MAPMSDEDRLAAEAAKLAEDNARLQYLNTQDAAIGTGPYTEQEAAMRGLDFANRQGLTLAEAASAFTNADGSVMSDVDAFKKAGELDIDLGALGFEQLPPSTSDGGAQIIPLSNPIDAPPAVSSAAALKAAFDDMAPKAPKAKTSSDTLVPIGPGNFLFDALQNASNNSTVANNTVIADAAAAEAAAAAARDEFSNLDMGNIGNMGFGAEGFGMFESFAEGGLVTDPMQQRQDAVGSRLMRQTGLASLQGATMSPEIASTLDRIMARSK